jgi:squalene monooxygenase
VLKDAKLPAPNHGHVVLGNNAPVLLYQISTHDTRILVDVPGKLPSVGTGQLHEYLRKNVLPDLPVSLQKPFGTALDSSERLKSMPNSFLPPSTNDTEGIILLGDAMNMRHPLTGGGMTVGFNDVILISKLLSPEIVPSFDDTRTVIKQMKTFHWQRKHLSSVINILAQALYSLFAANGSLSRLY